jgi:hypothetical protein
MYKTIVLPALCVSETLSFALREVHGLRVFETRVERRIFGRKRGEVAGGWRTLHNEELYNLYDSPNMIRVISQRGWDWRGMYHEWER